jgi:two-component system, chemotaxis family, chemotaxis protein CheY
MEIDLCDDILIAANDTVLVAELRGVCAADPSLTLHYATTLPEILNVLADHVVGCVIIGKAVKGFSGAELRRLLAEIAPGVPRLEVHRRLYRLIFNTGRASFSPTVLVRPLHPERTRNAIRRAIDYGHARAGGNSFRERIIFSPSQTEEKLLILQTSLDMLNHDARDLFIRILAVLSDLPEGTPAGTLIDYVNELYECTSEALGFMGSDKRIEPLIDIVNSIKLGREKIPLPSESRLKLSYGPRKLLFVEVSRLLKNAIAHVVENALKFSPPEEKIEVHIERREGIVSLTVSDRGSGIHPAERRRIFNRHSREASVDKNKGAGKGLWIASNIIREDHGDIAAAENPGGGTVVTVRLPAFRLTGTTHGLKELAEWFKLPFEVVEKKSRIMKTILQMELPAADTDLDSLAFANLLDHFRDERRKKERQKYYFKLKEYTRFNPSGKPVLLVDDSLYVHYTIAPILADQGFRIVDFAFNGVEAFNLYQIFTPELVVMDITMPVKSGIETAEDIFRLNPDAKILFITALGDHKPFIDNLARRFAGRRFGTLTKPIRAAKLLEAVAALLPFPISG